MQAQIIEHDLNKRKVTVSYPNSSLSQLNELRQSLLTNVRTCAIDVVIFHRNNSSRVSEIIAHRLGLCPIDNNKFNFDGEEYRKALHFVGPRDVSTDDIPDIVFVGNTFILKLQEGEELQCEIIIRYGMGRDHVKFSPVSVAYISAGNIVFEYLGVSTDSILNAQYILYQAWDRREQTMKVMDNIFFA